MYCFSRRTERLSRNDNRGSSGPFSHNRSFSSCPSGHQATFSHLNYEFGPRRHFFVDFSSTRPLPSSPPNFTCILRYTLFLVLVKAFTMEFLQKLAITCFHSNYSMETVLTGFSENFPTIHSLDSTFY